MSFCFRSYSALANIYIRKVGYAMVRLDWLYDAIRFSCLLYDLIMFSYLGDDLHCTL